MKCNGGEASIQERPWADPDAEVPHRSLNSVPLRLGLSIGETVRKEKTRVREPRASPQCASHLSDSVVFCTNHKPDEAVAEGTLRLLGATGAPSLDGVGRVEIYQGSDWGPVCADGWSTGSEAVRGGLQFRYWQ